MSHLGLEVLRGLAATRLDHLNHLSAHQGTFSSSLSSARVLWMARMTTMVAVLLLWFADELERFALGEPLESELSSEEKEEKQEEQEEQEEQEVASQSVASASDLVSSHRSEPMRCRWCRQEVMCEPNGEVFDLNHKPHGCGLRQVKTHRRRCHRNGNSSHLEALATPPSEVQA